MTTTTIVAVFGALALILILLYILLQVVRRRRRNRERQMDLYGSAMRSVQHSRPTHGAANRSKFVIHRRERVRPMQRRHAAR